MIQGRKHFAKGGSMNRSLGKVILFVILGLMTTQAAFANTIWGAIIGLGGYGTPQYVSSVRIITDRNEVFFGRAQYIEGPGLIWKADVPRITRNYRVEVTVSGDAAAAVRWNPEVAYGYWAWFQPTVRCNDVRFWLK